MHGKNNFLCFLRVEVFDKSRDFSYWEWYITEILLSETWEVGEDISFVIQRWVWGKDREEEIDFVGAAMNWGTFIIMSTLFI